MDDVTKTDRMLARKDGRVGYVIFNNPERRNAVDGPTAAALHAAFECFEADDAVT